MSFWPRLGPMVRSCTKYIGAASAPARSSSASSAASGMESRPVIRKLLPRADCTVARLIKPFSTTRFSVSTISIDFAGFGLGTVLDKQHRHPATDVIAGSAVHQVTTHRIHGDVNLRLAVLVERLLGICHVVTGRNNVPLQAG